MSAALTFGSVGDIIALCGLALELSRAVSSARGSPKEYQNLRTDLDQFVQVLTQVVATFAQFEKSPWLDNLEHVTKCIIDECGALIGEVLLRLREKYGESLQPGGSGSRVRDVYKKVEFSVRERERIQLVQETLNKAVTRLSLLSSCAALRSARADNATLLLRIEEVNQQSAKNEDLEALARAISRLELGHQSESQRQREQLHQFEDQLRQQQTNSTAIISSMGGISTAISEVVKMLAGLGEALVNIQVLLTNHRFFQGPTGEVLVFEDPFGRIDVFPVNWINTWDGLQELMELRFKGGTGYDMVLQRHYVLENDCNGDIIATSVPFSDAFRVCKKVNMSMLFETDVPESNAAGSLRCPRCDLPATVNAVAAVRCARPTCGMWFGFTATASAMQRPQQNNDVQRSWIKVAIESSKLPEPSQFQRVRFWSMRRWAAIASQQARDHNRSIHRRFQMLSELLIFHLEYGISLAEDRLSQYFSSDPEVGT